MLFVPLPLFVTLLLGIFLGRFVQTRDMGVRAHQLFACLVALYALQSLLASLRWGYGINEAATGTIIIAPILPAVAYLAYKTLSGRQRGWQLWPLAVVVANWVVYAIAPSLSDAMILMTYIGFGGLLLRLCRRGADHLSLSPINDAREILMAMCLTGGTLIASGLVDVFVIYDFVRNGGRNAGLVLTFVQTGFGLAIGVSAVFARATAQPAAEPAPQPAAAQMTHADSDIVARLEALFAKEKLHHSDDLSLRRLSRRLGVPDRQVSNAINRVRNMGVSQFVNGFRIEDACALLLGTDRTVLDISIASGFASKSNFNREFLRVTGQTPSGWRQARKRSAGERAP